MRRIVEMQLHPDVAPPRPRRCCLIKSKRNVGQCVLTFSALKVFSSKLASFRLQLEPGVSADRTIRHAVCNDEVHPPLVSMHERSHSVTSGTPCLKGPSVFFRSLLDKERKLNCDGLEVLHQGMTQLEEASSPTKTKQTSSLDHAGACIDRSMKDE